LNSSKGENNRYFYYFGNIVRSTGIIDDHIYEDIPREGETAPLRHTA